MKDWKEVEKRFLDTLDEPARSWVRRHVDISPGNDLALKKREELIEMFPGKAKEVEGKKRKTLKDTALIMTLAWQIAMRIRAKEYPYVDGNLRTAWYRYFEPLYVGKDLLESDVGEDIDAVKLLMPEVLQDLLKVEEPGIRRGMRDLQELFSGGGRKGLSGAVRRAYERVDKAARERYITNTMTGAFDAFVLKGIFQFKRDFGFVDPRESFRIIGQSRPRVIFFTEKEGLWWLCTYMAKKHKITAVASQGEPSLLAMEYLVEKLKRLRVKSVEVGAFTDYDPWGFLIAENFAEKLGEGVFFGKENVALTRLNGSQADLAKLFTKAELERGKRDLTMYSQYKQTQVRDWMNKTGGINGEPFGIHVDLAKPNTLKEVADGWVKSLGNGEKG